MYENEKTCSYCEKNRSDMVGLTITKGEEKHHIWLCEDCYEELLGEEE